MNTTSLLPSPDVLPLPATAGLLHFLLLLTFTVHVLFMNGLLGGVFLTLYSRLRQRTATDQHALLAGQLTKLLPSLVAGTVTFGVAPLLFLQVLFGQFFFTSSVIMGWSWFAVIVILLVAYYVTYLLSFAGERLGAARTPLLMLTVLLLATIAFIYTNNVTLMLRPDRWAEIYFANPRGTNLNLGDATVIPRVLHMVLGAIAVAGLLVAWLGHFKRNSAPERAAFMRRHGLSVLTWLTAANICVGLWFLLALERPVRLLMMGDSPLATALFGIGFILSVILLGVVAKAKTSGGGGSLGVVTGLLLLTMVAMVLLRDRVRAGYLDGIYAPQSFPVETQTFNLVLFAVLLLGGVATLVWMFRKLQRVW